MNNKTKYDEKIQRLEHENKVIKDKARELAMGILYLNECAVESGNELDYEIEKSVFEGVVGLVSS